MMAAIGSIPSCATPSAAMSISCRCARSSSAGCRCRGEALRLEGRPEDPRLIGSRTRLDYTCRLRAWARRKLQELEREDLCGFIFKSRSPVSGMERVRVYGVDGVPVRQGVGIWAGMFMRRFPLLPVEEEGRLRDPSWRENFFERVFVMRRWRSGPGQENSPARLVEFHARHKLLVMSHSITAYRELGRLVAGAGRTDDPEGLRGRYLELLAAALARPATVGKHVNVLQHVMGYFKRQLAPDQKQELLELIEAYGREALPLVVPVTMLNHYVRKYQEPYLAQQYYLNPHPLELKLRTHA